MLIGPDEQRIPAIDPFKRRLVEIENLQRDPLFFAAVAKQPESDLPKLTRVNQDPSLSNSALPSFRKVLGNRAPGMVVGM